MRIERGGPIHDERQYTLKPIEIPAKPAEEANPNADLEKFTVEELTELIRSLDTQINLLRANNPNDARELEPRKARAEELLTLKKKPK